MLLETVRFVVNSLNAHFKTKLNINNDIIVMANLTNQGESLLGEFPNRVIASLVNIEEERVKTDTANYVKTPTAFTKLYRPVHINFTLLFAANFQRTNYAEALQSVSMIIAYFQANPVFKSREHVDLNNQMEKLSAEIVSLDYHATSNLWNAMGARYMPHIMYRFRYITYQDNTGKTIGSVVRNTGEE